MVGQETNANGGVGELTKTLAELLPQGFKNEPMAHQIEAVEKGYDLEGFAQFGEQGTGKTWIFINECALKYVDKKCDGAVVIAPKGVDANWFFTEIPKHWPEGLPVRTALWRSALTKARKKTLDAVSTPKKQNEFRFLMLNWEALQTRRAVRYIEEFAKNCQLPMIICDESQRMKNPKTIRSKELTKLKSRFRWRRIGSGTPSLGSPFDLFNQMLFVDKDSVGTDSEFAFKARHAVLLKPGHPLYDSMLRERSKVMAAQSMEQNRRVVKAKNPGWSREMVEDEASKIAYEKAYEKMAKRMPQIVDKNAQGKPKYRKIEELREMIDPYMFRVLKSQCLDLPPKIYKKSYFEMTPEQKRYTKEIEEKLRIEWDDGTIESLLEITKQTKLPQLTCNYLIDSSDRVVMKLKGENPKLELLKQRIIAHEGDGDEPPEGKIIIWCYGRQEAEDVEALCKELGIKSVSYRGGISDAKKEANKKSFIEGDARIMISQQKSGGTGQTWVEADYVIYYSQRFDLEDRLQSEDRAHRKGQVKNVVYEDLVAEESVEEIIIDALQSKTETAIEVMGDKLRNKLY